MGFRPGLGLLAWFFCFVTLAQSGQEPLLSNDDALAAEMAQLIREVSRERYPKGTIKRFNQAKSLGCFNARFSVKEDIPENLKQGLFAKAGDYSALVRFASASTTDDRDKDLRGMSIRVFAVQGNTLWGEPGMQDFVLNSHPVLFARTPEEFVKFVRAQHEDALLSFFLNPLDSHLKALWILLNARDRPNSPLDIRYWSTTAFALGPQQVVKYSVQSCSTIKSDEPEEYSQNYLRAAMQKHLQQGPACFDFMLQLQTDPEDMPIEDASVLWDEEDSPFSPVARLQFEQQEFISAEALAECEQVAFNPWQAMAAHRPLGRMNYVRRQIYAELAVFRRQANRAPK